MKVYQEGWEDVSVGEYLDIIKIQQNTPGYINRCLEVLCYLTDSDEWENLSSKEVIQEYIRNSWLLNTPINTPISNKIGVYTFKPFNKLSLAEWIDLDDAIINGEISKIAAIVYRKTKVDEWGNLIYEPYDYSLNERKEEFNELSVTLMFGIRDEAYKYRENLLNIFAELFESYEGELSEEEKEMLSPGEIKEIESAIKDDNRKRDFAWQKLLDDISGGNWSTIPKVLELPHTFIFNMRLAKKIFEG